MGKVMINQGRSVPFTFRLAGTIIASVIIVGALNTLPEGMAIFVAILLSLLVPMLWFSFQILTIDPDSHEIHVGTWVMGYKTGKAKKYHALHKIFIDKAKTSHNKIAHGIEFHAFLKYDDDEKIFLVSDTNEERLQDEMTKIRKKLGLG